MCSVTCIWCTITTSSSVCNHSNPPYCVPFIWSPMVQVVNGNIPYGDTFFVSCQFCMTRVSHDKARLRITSNICFKKNCWGLVKSKTQNYTPHVIINVIVSYPHLHCMFIYVCMYACMLIVTHNVHCIFIYSHVQCM